MILVTRPFLPNLEEYQKYINIIWNNNILTNNGPLVNELESKLKTYFDSKNLLFTSNGTISIQIAIHALNIIGSEIITTPFSYVATTSCVFWENCKPVFADIDPLTFNIDPKEVEKKINKNTKAILATHVFGNPCRIDDLTSIAQKYNLALIFDAAHCFGSKYKEVSVMNFGDVSSISFHSTKLFHTIEGGALICNSDELFKKMSLMRNFGHNGFDVYSGVGINGKNSEFHAAMGLCNMNFINSILERRKAISEVYDNYLVNLPIKKQLIDTNNVEYNYSYYPIVFETEELVLKVKNELEKNEIFSRRYFYPSLNKLEYVSYEKMPNSEYLSERILCLPIYFELDKSDVKKICKIINHVMKKE